MKAAWLGLLSSLLLLPHAALAEDWPMLQHDASHTGFVDSGPRAPLRRAWIAKSPDPKENFTTWPVVKDGSVFASSGFGVLAVDTERGARQWFAQPPEGQGIVAPVADESKLYVPTPSGNLIALDRKTGTEVWRFKAEHDLTSPVLANGRIFVGSDPTEVDARGLYAINASDGTLFWKSTTRFRPDSTPAVAGGLVVFSSDDVNSNDAVLAALDANTGNEVWGVPSREANSSPAILGDRVIVGGGDFFAHALDLHSGKEIWRSPVLDKFDTRNFPAIAYGDVFLADRVGDFYRLDGKTGKRKWLFRGGEGTFDQSFPVIAGKTFFIGSSAGWLYALDVDSGKLLWKQHLGGFIYSGAADEKHFYFGVKFRNEGLYAYEHDPNGRLEPPPAEISPAKNVFAVVVVLGLFVLAAGLIRRRKPDS